MGRLSNAPLSPMLLRWFILLSQHCLISHQTALHKFSIENWASCLPNVIQSGCLVRRTRSGSRSAGQPSDHNTTLWPSSFSCTPVLLVKSLLTGWVEKRAAGCDQGGGGLGMEKKYKRVSYCCSVLLTWCSPKFEHSWKHLLIPTTNY